MVRLGGGGTIGDSQRAFWRNAFEGGGSAVLISQGGTYCALGLSGLLPWLREAAIPYYVLCHSCRERIRLTESGRGEALEYLHGAVEVGFVAEENRRQACLQLAEELPRSRVVQNPVNLDDLGTVPWPSSGKARLSCIARLEIVDKGQDLLLQALARPEWRDRAWLCSLYGSGPDAAYLSRLAQFLGLKDRVEFAGHAADVRKVWTEHEVLILPSRSEGTPLTLIEAMLCGRPAVVTRVGGNAEWISEGRTGFVAGFPGVEELSAALERAWQKRAQWSELGVAAREECLRRRDPQPGRTLFGRLAQIVQALPQ